MQNDNSARLPVFAFGMSLALFLVISYILCVIGYLLFPGLPINHSVLSIFLPGFEHHGVRYRSLSEVARAISGTRWSGPRFFGLEGDQPNPAKMMEEVSS